MVTSILDSRFRGPCDVQVVAWVLRVIVIKDESSSHLGYYAIF